MTDLDADVAAVRERLAAGRRDSELLDGRDFNVADWMHADAALDRLTERMQQLEDANAAWGTAAGEFSVRAEAAEAQKAALREPILALKAEGWFAAWSDDPRVVAINAALATPEDAPKEGA